MEDFNFENASKFLEECQSTGKRSESARQVILRLAPQIRTMMANGYTQREIYDLLVEKFRLELGFSAFRNYLSTADKAKDE